MISSIFGTHRTATHDERKVGVGIEVNRINELIENIDAGMGLMEKATDTAPYRKLMSRLKALQQDPRYSFMFGSVDN